MVKKLAGAIVAGSVVLGTAALAEGPANDYPTAARADYVFGCMASNGQTQEMLNRCSCSIDVIASILPYDQYVEAETVLRMRLVGGERTAMFKTAEPAKKYLEQLKRAQAEAEIRCF